jgi:DNA-binding response OmpR family regulator
MNTNSDKTIMVVDDDPNIVKALALRLNSAGYQTMTTFNGMTALILARLKKPDLIIADIWMPAGCGLSLAFRMKELLPSVPLIFLTASKQPGLEQKARELGAAGYLEKPYEPEALLELISRTLKEKEQAEGMEQLSLIPVATH